jgi:hypothetical protein
VGADGEKVLMRGLLLLPLVALALAAGCGGGELSPDAAVARAATKTADAGRSRIAFTANIKPPAAISSDGLEFGGEGVLDYERHRARVEYDLSGLLQAAGQETENAEAEIVFDRRVLYIRFPLLAQSLPGGKEWVKIDLKKVSEAQGIDLGQLSQLGQSDPSQLLDYLRATSQGVETVGEDEIRGVDTTHYRGAVDLTEVADQAPAEVRADVRAAMESLMRQTRKRTVPVDVWVDGDGLLRRERIDIAFEVSGGASGEPQEAAMSMTVDFFDFGVDVDAEPPPADQVADLTKLATWGGTG